jgi:hypothetical protein
MKKILLLLTLVSVIFILGCGNSVPEELQCSEDFECVPDECCHADGTINRDFAPECMSMLCTAECVEGTIDCGQADLKCVENKCQVVWEE